MLATSGDAYDDQGRASDHELLLVGPSGLALVCWRGSSSDLDPCRRRTRRRRRSSRHSGPASRPKRRPRCRPPWTSSSRQGRRAQKKHRTGQMADRVADVEVYLDAVRRPLKYDERLYAGRGSTPVAYALQTLTTGNDRADQLANGHAPWMTESGVRGFYSRIDGSAQPYILTMPLNYDAAAKRRYRLDIFMHGRDDTVLEQQFMAKSDDRLRLEAARRRGRSVHAATVRPLHQRQPVRGRDRRPRSDRVGREGVSDRSQPPRHDRLLDGRGLRVVLHRALRRSVGRRRSRCGLHRNRGVPARRPRAGNRRTPCRERCGTCTTRPTTRSTRSTCRSSRTPARTTARNRPPTRWLPR